MHVFARFPSRFPAAVFLILVLLTGYTQATELKPNKDYAKCCNDKGGICGCACCDGTKLSRFCANLTPACDPELMKIKEKRKKKQQKYKESTVIRFIAGDIFRVYWQGKMQKVRLSGIDSPEKDQPFGDIATSFAEKLLKGATLRIVQKGMDRYKRPFVEIYLPDGRHLNVELLKAGLAWVVPGEKQDKKLKALENQAKAEKKGLWAAENPISPWDWRKGKRSDQTPKK